ncbi:MAG TPA: LPS assembly lipoprotein LptE [Gammaproteobacteria bacterium]|nr:LPS assembly lipoprotein LptE [Gammaproteobacteria bacterium]
MKRARLPLVLLLAVLCAACGFHLHQAPNLPAQMRIIYVSSSGQNADLVRELRRNLATEDTQVVLDPATATATLAILRAEQSSRPLTFNYLGRPTEYEAAYHVEFSMMAGGVVIMPPQVLSLTRSYNFSTSNAVGNEEQANAVFTALTHEMAQLIVFRIQAAAKRLAPAPRTAAQPAPASLPPAGTVTLPAAATATPTPVS